MGFSRYLVVISRHARFEELNPPRSDLSGQSMMLVFEEKTCDTHLCESSKMKNIKEPDENLDQEETNKHITAGKNETNIWKQIHLNLIPNQLHRINPRH